MEIVHQDFPVFPFFSFSAQSLNDRRPKAFDVHAFAGCKMDDTVHNLGGTLCIGAIQVYAFPVFLHPAFHRGTADRTEFNTKRDRFSRAFFLFNHSDFWNNIAALVNDNRVADTYVQRVDKCLIVKCCSNDRCACKAHRVKLGHRRDTASPASLQSDIPQDCRFFFGRIFERNSPFGTLSAFSQFATLTQAIHLHNSTVNGIT